MKNQTDEKFGLLTVIGPASETEMKCICKCGRVLNVAETKLKNGTISSCTLCSRKSARKRRKKLSPSGKVDTKKIRLDFQINKMKKEKQAVFLGLLQNDVLVDIANSLGIKYSPGFVKKENIIQDILKTGSGQRNNLKVLVTIEMAQV